MWNLNFESFSRACFLGTYLSFKFLNEITLPKSTGIFHAQLMVSVMFFFFSRSNLFTTHVCFFHCLCKFSINKMVTPHSPGCEELQFFFLNTNLQNVFHFFKIFIRSLFYMIALSLHGGVVCIYTNIIFPFIRSKSKKMHYNQKHLCKYSHQSPPQS